MKKDIKFYIKEARKYYDENHINYIPDCHDIAGCACDFMEQDSGIEIWDDEYQKVLKQVKGE